MRLRPVQYRAVVRFSVLDPEWTGWRESRAERPVEEYRYVLWSAPRMEHRTRVFTELAAPIYAEMAQRHDLRVLVQHSPDLAEPWVTRLRQAADQHPVLRLVPTPTLVESRETVHEDLRQDGHAGTVVMLRVDDDDLLSADFLDLLEPHVTRAHHGWCISLSQGLAARPGGAALCDFREYYLPLSSMGQAFVGTYHRRRDRLDLTSLLPHRLVPQTLPTVVDAREPAFVQVRDASQDTRVGTDREEAERVIRRGLARLPRATTTPELERKFPTLVESLRRG